MTCSITISQMWPLKHTLENVGLIYDEQYLVIAKDSVATWALNGNINQSLESSSYQKDIVKTQSPIL